MDLRQYRIEHGISLAHLARRAGASPDSLYSIAAGRRRPSWKLAGAIERATGGLVERAQWFEGAVLAVEPHNDQSPSFDRAESPIRSSGEPVGTVAGTKGTDAADCDADRGDHAGNNVNLEPEGEAVPFSVIAERQQ
jgi:DNA-binding XRE family transcriptional regulator